MKITQPRLTLKARLCLTTCHSYQKLQFATGWSLTKTLWDNQATSMNFMEGVGAQYYHLFSRLVTEGFFSGWKSVQMERNQQIVNGKE